MNSRKTILAGCLFILPFVNSCHNKIPGITIQLVSVRDNYYQDISLHKKYGWYKRQLSLEFEIRNIDKRNAFLPYYSRDDKVWASHFEVWYNGKKIENKTFCTHDFKKNHYILFPYQSTTVLIYIDIPSSEKETKIKTIIDKIRLYYKPSLINKILPTNITYLGNKIENIYYREKADTNTLCIPYL